MEKQCRRLEGLRELPGKPSTPSAPTAPAETRCFTIKDIEIKGADQLSEADREQLTRPRLGNPVTGFLKCGAHQCSHTPSRRHRCGDRPARQSLTVVQAVRRHSASSGRMGSRHHRRCHIGIDPPPSVKNRDTGGLKKTGLKMGRGVRGGIALRLFSCPYDPRLTYFADLTLPYLRHIARRSVLCSTSPTERAIFVSCPL